MVDRVAPHLIIKSGLQFLDNTTSENQVCFGIFIFFCKNFIFFCKNFRRKIVCIIIFAYIKINQVYINYNYKKN